MKNTLLQLSTVLVLMLSACGEGTGDGSLRAKIDKEHSVLLAEHRDLQAEHDKMVKDFRNMDAKYKQKVKEPDSTYNNFVKAHEELLQNHNNIIVNHTGLLETLEHKEDEKEAELQKSLDLVLSEDKKIEQTHKELKGKHDKFSKEHSEMMRNIDKK